MTDERLCERKQGAAATDWKMFCSLIGSDYRFFFDGFVKNSKTLFLYMADLKSGLFYLSDNMRDTFGFSDNLMPNFNEAWLSRIHGEKERAIYLRATRQILAHKLEYSDIRYEVEDKDGNVFWVRSCCNIQWNESRTKIVRMSGRLYRQEDSFVIDQASNFFSHVSLKYRLREFSDIGCSFTAIGLRDLYLPSLSHLYGVKIMDQMLSRICRQILDEFDDELVFYRLPGNQAVAVAERITQEKVLSITERIQEIVRKEYRKLDFLEDRILCFAAVDFPNPSLDPLDLEQTVTSLLDLAEKSVDLPCMYLNSVSVDQICREERLKAVLLSDVAGGMNHFRIVIQPIADTETGEILAGETLLRWNFEGEEISPAKFIPILEACNKMVPVGNWVLERAVMACKKIIRWKPDFYLSVNASIQQFSKEFCTFIREQLKKHNLPGKHLVIEITESCLDTSPVMLRLLMTELQKEGIRFALDDLGTGYASLQSFLQYPTSIIKLDRSLVLALEQSRQNTTFIEIVVYGCHVCGKKVCIEGIETQRQYELAKKSGCDLIQGFLHYTPMELPDVYALLMEPEQSE